MVQVERTFENKVEKNAALKAKLEHALEIVTEEYALVAEKEKVRALFIAFCICRRRLSSNTSHARSHCLPFSHARIVVLYILRLGFNCHPHRLRLLEHISR